MVGWRDARQGAGREERKLGAGRFIFSHYYFKTRSKSFILFCPFFFGVQCQTLMVLSSDRKHENLHEYTAFKTISVKQKPTISY